MPAPAGERTAPSLGRLLALLVVTLVVYNVARSAVIPSGVHLVTNVALAATLVLLALAAGMTVPELGLDPDRWRSGAWLGLGAFAVIALVVIVAALVPASKGYFDDDRVQTGLGSMLVRVLVVIPVGTVVVEELIFRGILHGLLRRRLPIVPAALWGATLFGLWHLFPVWRGSDAGGAGRWGAVAGTFVATFVAGLGFISLRHRSGSLLAPVFAHIGTNSIPFAVAWIVAS